MVIYSQLNMLYGLAASFFVNTWALMGVVNGMVAPTKNGI
jgi:hypothetical protein